MSTSYLAPAFRVEINATRLDAEVSRNVLQIQVTNEPDTLDSVSLTLANPYPDMPWTHTDSADLFKAGSAIKVEMGYVDALQPIFDGEITKVSASFPNTGSPTVKIEGHTRLHRLKATPMTRTFVKVTDSEVAETIAGEAGLTRTGDKTDTKHDHLFQYNQTNFAFLSGRARRIDFEILGAGKSLIFRKARPSELKYTLVWGHPLKSVAPQDDRLPLTSLDVSMNPLRQVSEVVVRGYDAKKKEPIEGRAGASDAGGTIGGGQSGGETAAESFGNRREAIEVATPIASATEAKELAKASYQRRALEFVNATGSTIGAPDLRAGQKVWLEGVGARFKGEYYVTQSVHTIGGSGYQTGFSLRRSAAS